jgi:hypothetical protein
LDFFKTKKKLLNKIKKKKIKSLKEVIWKIMTKF